MRITGGRFLDGPNIHDDASGIVAVTELAGLPPEGPLPVVALERGERIFAELGQAGLAAAWAQAVARGRGALPDFLLRLAAALVTSVSIVPSGGRIVASSDTRLVAFLRTAVRMQRLAALTGLAELVAARPSATGGWELAVVRHGRLAGASTTPGRTDPRPFVRALVATAETVRPGPGPTPCASAEETERIERWLGGPGVRLVHLDGEWSWPATGAARLLHRYA